LNAKQARRLKVHGIVQGVGFRPFVYQLAHRHHLVGQVANTSEGVTIFIEGDPAGIDGFCHELKEKAPPLSKITSVIAHQAPLKSPSAFTIVTSRTTNQRATLISPDTSVCADCLSEMFDKNDPRFGYPFINCTNCGPRYTIIKDIPYDRPKTSMKHFRMCPACQAEYEDPASRRFHAQPNACPACGPQVALFTNQKEIVVATDPIATTAELLKKGYIVAVKGLGGFHLAADAQNQDTLKRLRKKKNREEKPFAVMSFDLDKVSRFSHTTPAEVTLLNSPNRPIVLLKKKKSPLLAPAVAPRNQYFGVMLPYTPLHYLLLRNDFLALVMTSGNLSDEPICIDNDDAFERLKNIADYLLIHDRDIYLRSDDSIVRKAAGATRFIRRSRGYVPVPVFLKNPLPPILACGAELKNTICLTRNNQAFVSQHVGDLENLETYRFMELTINHLKRILDIKPEIIAHDMHPDYLSTQYATSQSRLTKVAVQHHHAHVVSCMAENKKDGPVIGLAFDGTGYGADGNIWGSEILICSPADFKRAAHIAYVPMPGASAAIRQPWRMGLSYLIDAYGDTFRDLNIPFLDQTNKSKIETVQAMCARRFNAPLTSSLGRLFDAVAAIIGLRNDVHYEGQAAMELEMAACDLPDHGYGFDFKTTANIRQILPGPIITSVVTDLKKGISIAQISAKFHKTLIDLFAHLCTEIGNDTGIRQVALSGGSFQNTILLEGLIQILEKKGFEVLSHSELPCNDGDIALGQAVAAAAIVAKDK